MDPFKIGERVHNLEFGNGTVFGYLKEHDQLFIVFDKPNAKFHKGDFQIYRSGGPSDSNSGFFMALHELKPIGENNSIERFLPIARSQFKLGTYFDNSNIISGCKGIHGPVDQSPYIMGSDIVVSTKSGNLYTVYRDGKWADIVNEMDVLLAKAIKTFPVGCYVDNSNIFGGGPTSLKTTSIPFILTKDICVNVDNRIIALYREGTWAILSNYMSVQTSIHGRSSSSGDITEDEEIFLRRENTTIRKMIDQGKRYHPIHLVDGYKAQHKEKFEISDFECEFQFRGYNKDSVKLHTKPEAKKNKTLEGVVVKLDRTFEEKKRIKIF